jgi:hypothetical protein
MDIRVWRSVQGVGDAGVTDRGVGSFEGGVLTANSDMDFGAGGSDTGTRCN